MLQEQTDSSGVAGGRRGHQCRCAGRILCFDVRAFGDQDAHRVEDHGGEIRVEDNVPRGARFVIELPA
jgi:hypothetical protein